MKTYTTGQIYRLGLLKNHEGKPYKHKATVLNLVRRLKHTRVKTRFGMGYAVSEGEITKHNDAARRNA